MVYNKSFKVTHRKRGLDAVHKSGAKSHRPVIQALGLKNEIKYHEQ